MSTQGTLERVQAFEEAAKELSELLRILAQWEARGGEEDKVRRLLADAVSKSRALSQMQERILEDLSHLKESN
jgi:predicted small metal-binding protein